MGASMIFTEKAPATEPMGVGGVVVEGRASSAQVSVSVSKASSVEKMQEGATADYKCTAESRLTAGPGKNLRSTDLL